MRNGAVGATAGALALVVVAALAGAWVIGGRSFEAGAPVDAPAAVPATGAGDTTVALSADAAAHPAGGAVRARLQTYFDAINARDHAAWAASVTAGRAAEQPEAAWQAGIRSTHDGTARVDRIDPQPGGLLALVRFTSTQDPADAPAELRAGRICWRTAWVMTGSDLRIATAAPGTTLSQPC